MLSTEIKNLLNDLGAPIKSFRIFALEELIKSGDSKELLDELIKLKALESDQECLMLFEHAIAAINDRISGTNQEPLITKDQDFNILWEKASDTQQMNLISSLPARLPKDLRDKGPQLLATAKSYVVAARVVRLFCRNWPKEQFDLITNMVKSDSLILRLAAIRTLVHMSPELLINDLPSLLASEDPQLKALAIRALVKIDKEEALNHLQALLLSSSEADRLAGIQNCLFLPFDMVKSPLLKYFAAETNSELLTRAGWLLEMNPDVQVPFYLYEILERSNEVKAQLVKKILNSAVQLLDKSGILGDKFAQYTENLQAYVVKKNALRFAKQVVANLNIDKVPQNIDAKIKTSLKQSKQIQEAFKEALTWPISELVKKHLTAYLAQTTSLDASVAAAPVAAVTEQADVPSKPSVEAEQPRVEAASPAQEPTASKRVQATQATEAKQTTLKAQPLGGSFPELSEEKQFALLSELDEASAIASKQEIIKLIKDRGSSHELKAALVGVLTRFKLKGLENESVKYISNPNLVFATSAVEYLGAVDPERIFPYLGQCLKVADINMKSATLGILKNFDFNQALSYLDAMLYSTDPKQQHMGILCMDQFDFGLIRDQLTEYLCRCTTENLAESGLCHFAANPSYENQYALYKIEQAHTGKIAEQAKVLRENCPQKPQEAMAAAGPEGVEESKDENDRVEQDLKERLKAEQAKKKAQKPAYAYKAKGPESSRNSKAQLEAIYFLFKEKLLKQYKWVLFVFLLLGGFLFWDFFVPKGSVKSSDNAGALAVNQHVREGRVEQVDGTTIVFVTVQKERFVLAPQREGYRVPREGTLLRISLIPFRKYPDGSFVARIRSMREISEYSEEVSGAGK